MRNISITSRYETISGIKTFYEYCGYGNNETIVCFHSEGRESRQFHRLMDALSKDYYVVAFDMPAHGKTWPVDGKYPISDWNTYVNFAWEFIKHMHFENAVLIGCGLGASLVFTLAQMHPIKAVISISGTENTLCDMDYDLINNPYISTPHMLLEYNRSVIGRTADEYSKNLIIWQSWCETGITLKEDIRMLCNLDMTENMKNIHCPVLMICGEDDWTICDEDEEKTLSHISGNNKEYLKVKGAGRFAMIEQAEMLSDIIRKFLG